MYNRLISNHLNIKNEQHPSQRSLAPSLKFLRGRKVLIIRIKLEERQISGIESIWKAREIVLPAREYAFGDMDTFLR